MADITAARPVAGAAIETGWGTEVHDQIEGMQTGVVNVSASSASTGTAPVTFPRPYASPPRVLLTVTDTGGSNGRAHCWVSGAITTTGFTAAAGRDDATTYTATVVVTWLAIGTPA